MQEQLTYKGITYSIVSEDETTLILTKDNKKHIHINKDSRRYQDIKKEIKDLDTTSEVSKVIIVDTTRNIVKVNNNEFTEDDYASDLIAEFFAVATSRSSGKQSTKDIVKTFINDNKKYTKLLRQIAILLHLYVIRGVTAKIIGLDFDSVEKLVKTGSIEFKPETEANAKEFIDKLDDLVMSKKKLVDNVADLVSYIPESSKFHLTTALCGYFLADNINLTKKECIIIIEELNEELHLFSETEEEFE